MNKIRKIHKLLSQFQILDILIHDKNNQQQKFIIVNKITDFIVENKECLFSDEYKNIVELLYETVEYCNSSEYKTYIFNDKYNRLAELLETLYNAFVKKIKVKIYIIEFSENDNILNLFNYKLVRKQDIEFIRDISEIHKNCDSDPFKIYVLISKSDIDDNYILQNKVDCIVNYEKFINNLFNVFCSKYDYYYLKRGLKNSKTEDIEAIVVGLSYSWAGINEQMLNKKTINLSLPSQDLYYSYKIAENIIYENKKIKYCIIGVSYYSLYFDLSMSTKSEIERIRKVYYPLLNDKHNCNIIDTDLEWNFHDKMIHEWEIYFDKNSINKYFDFVIENGKYYGYFNNVIKRKSLLGITSLDDLKVEDRIKYGKKRADEHNKLIKYKDTFFEYKKIFKEFIEYLIKNNVRPVIISFPFSKYYMDNLSSDFKNEFYDEVNVLKSRYEFEFIDLNDYKIFEDSDFIDMDHLNERGAYKVSKIINFKIFSQ